MIDVRLSSPFRILSKDTNIVLLLLLGRNCFVDSKGKKEEMNLEVSGRVNFGKRSSIRISF